jgi:hypothetical protein
MKTFFATLFIALASFVSVAQAGGNFFDGNKLYKDMTSSNTGDRDHALGYVVGVHDGIRQLRDCVPDNAKSGQIRDIVMATLRDHPELRHLPARNIIVVSLNKAFDCKLFDKPAGSSL